MPRIRREYSHDFLFIVEEGDTLKTYLKRVNDEICKWCREILSKDDYRIVIDKRQAVLRDPKAGFCFNNLAAYYWKYKYIREAD